MRKIDHIPVVAVLWTVLCAFSFLDDVARKVEQGNEHFDRAEFQEALKAYQEAQTDRPDAPELHFNLGDALYKTCLLYTSDAADE